MPPKNARRGRKPSSGSKPISQAQKTKWSDTLAKSHTNEDGFILNGIDLPHKSFNSLARMATILGFTDKNEVSKFMVSSDFGPIFKTLWDTAIAPRKRLSKRAQGPKLSEVQRRLSAGEAFGDQVYSRWDVNTKDFDEIDHYALALHRLKATNTTSRTGLFIDQIMTDAEKECRLWECILRATMLMSESKQRTRRRAREKPSNKTLVASHPFGDVIPGKAGPSNPIESPEKKRRKGNLGIILKRLSQGRTPKGQAVIPPQSHSSSSSTTLSPGDKPNNNEEGEVEEEDSLFVPDSGAYQDLFSDSSSDEDFPKEASDDVVESEDEQPDLAELSAREAAEGDEQLDAMSNMQRLLATKNDKSPFDLKTNFGKYLTVHTALAAFDDAPTLQRLTNGPNISDINDEETNRLETLGWASQINAVIANVKSLNLMETSPESQNAQSAVEALRDNPRLQPMDFNGACKKLFNMNPRCPVFKYMRRNKPFRSWQVTGIAHMIQLYEQNINTVILADATGLGKTWTMLGHWLYMVIEREKILKRHAAKVRQYEDARIASSVWEGQNSDDEDSSLENPHVIPPAPVNPTSPPKPVIFLMMHDLISQFVKQTNRFSSKIKLLTYHGDYRAKKEQGKVFGRLCQNHEIFDGANGRDAIGVITSIETLRKRHGPEALYEHRRSTLKWGIEKCTAMYSIPDPDWEYDLAGLFQVVYVDECHVIKNQDTASHAMVAWLKTQKFLSSAYVLSNRISDATGYFAFMSPSEDLYEKASLTALEVTENTNPFELPPDHPGRVLCKTVRACEKYISGPDADREKAGFYLEQVWQTCMVRRTYASKDPAEPARTVGHSIAPIHSRRLNAPFTTAEVAVYDNYSAISLARLVTRLKNGKLAWNRKHSRRLTLTSTWLGFYWIEKHFFSSDIKRWKKMAHPLWEVVRLLHENMTEAGVDPGFVVPEKQDVCAQLAIVFRGSPKLRAVCRVLSELVIFGSRKMIIWSSLPANQILLHAVLSALKISSGTYSSELTTEERSSMVDAFTEQPTGHQVWNGTYYVGSFGLNLQALCNHALEWDAPPSMGLKVQSTGRVRRIGQTKVVELIEAYTSNSFQSRIMSNMISKALPGIMAELSINIDSVERLEGEERTVDIGNWWLADNELIDETDPRSALMDRTQTLSPLKFIEAMMNICRGEETHILTNPDTWINEDLDNTLFVSRTAGVAGANSVFPIDPKATKAAAQSRADIAAV